MLLSVNSNNVVLLTRRLEKISDKLSGREGKGVFRFVLNTNFKNAWSLRFRTLIFSVGHEEINQFYLMYFGIYLEVYFKPSFS